MNPGLLTTALLVLPLSLFAPVWERTADRQFRWFTPGLWAFLGGFALCAVCSVVLAIVEAQLGIVAHRAPDVVSTAFELLVRSPLEESARALAVVVPLRSKRLSRPYDAMRISAGASLGFTLLDAVLRAEGTPPSAWLALGLLAHVAGHVSLSVLWGYAIGRERRRRLGGRAFTRAFTLAVVFGGIAGHLIFERGRLALSAVAPLLVSSMVASLIARRDLLRLSDRTPKKRLSRFLPLRTPSLEELEQVLLRKPERPLHLRWIAFGALVTTGVLVSSITISIAMGQRGGVDFSTIDSSDSFENALPPLILLGVATLLAFPLSGFLVAKASAARSVLEPALASSIAILAILVLVGLATPVAVVFGLAVAPPAFALACAGAFIGLER